MKTRAFDKVKGYFMAHKTLCFFMILTGLLFDGLMVFIPLYQGKLILELSTDASLEKIGILCIGFVAFVLFVQFNRFLKRYFVRLFANKITLEMRGHAMKNIMNQEQQAINKISRGDILNRVFSDIGDVAEGIRKATTEFFDTIVLMLSYFISLFILDYRLSFVVLFFVLMSMLISLFFKNHIYKRTMVYKKRFSTLKDETLTIIENEYNYRALGLASQMDEDYEKSLEDTGKKAIRANIMQGSMEPLYYSIALLGLIFVIFIGGKNYQSGLWKIDAFTAYLTTFFLVATKASKAGKMFNAIQKANVSWQRCRPYLKNIKVREQKKMMAPVHLECQNVSFGFDKQCYFNNFSLSCDGGNTIGICGRVHSGKSTLAALFSGLYSYGGSIKINGDELYELQVNFISHVLSYMPADEQIFDDSLSANIILKRVGDYKDVLSIVKLDQEVSDNISPRLLSGGQKKRMGIARAILSQNPIIILDDPFNALNQDMAMEIMDNISNYCPKSLIFVVSNDEKILRKCQKIIHLDDNQNIEFATYDVLDNRSSSFTSLMKGASK